MRAVVSLSPNAIAYIKKMALRWYGQERYKFSVALERIIQDHKRIRNK